MLKVAWEAKSDHDLNKMLSFNLQLLRWLGVGFYTQDIKFVYLVLSNLFWWLFNLAMVVIYIYHEFPYLFGVVHFARVGSIVGPTNYAVHTFLVFVATWWMSRFHGPSLWTSMQQMAQYIDISSEDVLHCQRASKTRILAAFAVISLHVTGALMDVINHRSANETDWNEILYLIALVPYLYSLLSSVLFINLGRIIQMAFKTLALDLKQKRPLSCLSIWEFEHKFSIISQVADNLQNSFAFILFLTVSYTFVGFIMASYNLFLFFQELPTLADHVCIYCKMSRLIYFIVEHLMRLWLVCHVPDEIHSEAYSLVPILQSIRNELYCQRWFINADSEEVHAFILEVSETCPRYEIYGMFSLTKQVVVSLIGTTLTYLVVLSQFATNSNPTAAKR